MRNKSEKPEPRTLDLAIVDLRWNSRLGYVSRVLGVKDGKRSGGSLLLSIAIISLVFVLGLVLGFWVKTMV